MCTEIHGLNFQPWVSENYRNNSGLYGKLLILGESHYIENEDGESDSVEIEIAQDLEQKKHRDFTTSIVEGFIREKYDINFFRNIGLLFNQYDRYEVWKNVGFANAIQFGLRSAKSQPTKEHINTVESAFWLLLENLRPEKVLVCSKRMWNNWLPGVEKGAAFVESLNFNDKHSEIWRYSYSGGRCLAIGIRHPSSYFSYSSWSPLIKKFVNLPFENT